MASTLPDIYFFNPTCEYAVGNGNASWQPNRLLQKMELDLAGLPMFFSHSNDFVLADKLPSSRHLEQFAKLNLKPPKFILKKEALQNAEFLSLPKGKLLPWGWSPAAHKILAPLKPSCSKTFLSSPVSNWQPWYREFYSKKFAFKILNELQNECDDEVIISYNLKPQICTTQKEIELSILEWGKLMLKAPWSSSGRGLQTITKTPVHPKVWEKILGVINNQGYIIVEPLLNKAMDLAFQFVLKNKKVSYIGISNFTTDKKGQYLGNFLNGIPDNINPEVKSFANTVPGKFIPLLTKAIENCELAENYEGNFGVDMLIFLDRNKKLKINPCLEINVRLNMGVLSLCLEKLIQPNKKGMFNIYYKPGVSFMQFKNEMTKNHPLKISQNKIQSGFFPLTDADNDTLFGAYLMV